MGIKEDFTKIYDKQKWGKGKGSGTGSSPVYAAKYLSYLSGLLTPSIHVLDLGCGDWQLYEKFDWKGAHYVGVDIVEGVVKDNQEKHPDHLFLCENFSDPDTIEHLLTHGDVFFNLILIKDVLQHWSDEEIDRWWERLKELSFGAIIAVNNWQYFRSPEKNGTVRDIKNQYRWAPVDMTKYGFKVVDYYPRGRFKQIAIYQHD